MKKLFSLIVTAAFLGSAVSYAAGNHTAQFTKTLSAVPAAELPAKCAKLVTTAKARDRGFTTASVVKTAVELNPAAAPAIAAAIAKAAPEMAPIAAAAAAEAQPSQAADIARAAAGAAPTKAGKIAASVCRVAPNAYRNVAVAVAQAVPGAGAELLKSIASLFPELKPGIEAALVGYGANPPSVAAVLDSLKLNPSVMASESPAASNPDLPQTQGFSRGPTLAPPYVPISGTPANVTPSTSGTVPQGGRNYAAP